MAKKLEDYLVKYMGDLERNDLKSFAEHLYYDPDVDINERIKILKFLEFECDIDFAEALAPVLPQDFSYIPRKWIIHHDGLDVNMVIVPDNIKGLGQESMMDVIEISTIYAPGVEVLDKRCVMLTSAKSLFLTNNIKTIHPDAFDDSGSLHTVSLECSKHNLDDGVREQLEAACFNAGIKLWDAHPFPKDLL